MPSNGPSLRRQSTVTDWLDDLVNTQAETRMSLLLDMGGGDQVFKRFAASLDLAALLQAEGIMPVALHFFGPDIDDLGYLRDIEESGAFCPAQTVLVLNAGLIKDTRPVDVAFAGMREHPIYLAALKRGAKEIVLRLVRPVIPAGRRRHRMSQALRSSGPHRQSPQVGRPRRPVPSGSGHRSTCQCRRAHA